MLMRTIILCIAILAGGVCQAQAYRWTDENGIVQYSDRPVEGAEQIYLPENNRRVRPIAAAQNPTAARAAANNAAADAAPATPFKYEIIEVVAPAPEETLWNIGGTLNVSLRVEPELRPEHQVRVYFDGEPRIVSGASFQLDEVYRGVHNIQAEVIDETGTLMARSLPNRFYVQQNSVIRPN